MENFNPVTPPKKAQTIFGKFIEKWLSRRTSLAAGISLLYIPILAASIILVDSIMIIALWNTLILHESTALIDTCRKLTNSINTEEELKKNISGIIAWDNSLLISIYDENGDMTYCEKGFDEYPELPLFESMTDQDHFKRIYAYSYVVNNIVLTFYEESYGDILQELPPEKTIYLQVSRVLNKEYKNFQTLCTLLASVSALVILIVWLLSYIQARRYLRPLSHITETVRNITIQNLNHIQFDVKPESKKDIYELADSFNNMLSKFYDAYEHQKQFVSDVSHELRTPLAIIKNYADTLGRWGYQEEDTMNLCVDTIKTEVDNMIDLIENLLNIRSEDKSYVHNMTEIDFSGLAADVVADIKALRINHNIVNNVPSGIIIYADKTMTIQLLRILLDNAVKYTPVPGTITVNARITEIGTEFSVSDTGIGISDEDINKIFDRFFRTDASKTKITGTRGLGLGLAIAQRIIDTQGWSIRAESSPGKGTTMIVVIPSVSHPE